MHRGIPMRTLMKVQMDTEAASEAIRNGTMQATLESVMEQLNLEAAYFTAEGGQRTAYIVFDLREPSQIPSIAEPLFQPLKAKIDMSPVMNAEDVRVGIQNLMKSG
jgi:hypothetical protein